MKKIIIMLMLLVSFGALNVLAEEALVEVNNKTCPISGRQIGEGGMKAQKVTYNGKVYNLCCGMCKKDFMKDPAKFAQMLDEQVAKEEVKM